MHNNAQFLNACEFGKRRMRFHLWKSVVPSQKKFKRLTEHQSHKNVGSSKPLFQENEIV